MAATSIRSTTHSAKGRLPAPVFDWPLSEERFKRLARVWRSHKVWLSLWNLDGVMIACDEEADPFWMTLRRSSGTFLESAAVFVRAASDCGAVETGDGTFDPSALGPWGSDVGLVTIPICFRKRRIGSVLAAFASTAETGEDFDRLCHQCGLDRAAMANLLRKTGVVTCREMTELAGLLSYTIEQAREIDVAQRDISSLTWNLQNTYEELHLIYEVSRELGIPQEPLRMLKKVGLQMLDVSRATCFAFVASEADPQSGESEGKRSRCLLNPENHVVQVGPGAPRLGDILRLTDCIDEIGGLGGEHLLLNRATDQAGLRWASGWLEHLVVLPLRSETRLFGIFYAINHIDDGDFTSEDVQLLRAVADRITAALQNQHLYDDLADLLMGLLHALVNSVDAKDTYTLGHSERVAEYSRALAQATDMSRIERERVYLAGLLHDVGKIGVPDAILVKPGRLTKEEFDALKKHPEIGQRILSHVPQIRDLLPGVLYHHERMDGCGYPQGLVGRTIPLLGRIICLADSFDAMTTNRTYRAAMSVDMAIAEIRRCSGNQFDPILAEQFLGIDPERLYREAHSRAGGVLNISRIGALCASLGGHPYVERFWGDEAAAAPAGGPDVS